MRKTIKDLEIEIEDLRTIANNYIKSTIVSKTDIEIEQLRAEILLLNDRVEELEKLVNKKSILKRIFGGK